MKFSEQFTGVIMILMEKKDYNECFQPNASSVRTLQMCMCIDSWYGYGGGVGVSMGMWVYVWVWVWVWV